MRTYIGCGQVVNMRKSSKIAYEYALEYADKKSLERLKGIDCSYQAEGWLDDLLFVAGIREPIEALAVSRKRKEVSLV